MAIAQQTTSPSATPPQATATHKLLADNYRAESGPIYAAVWATADADLFQPQESQPLPTIQSGESKFGTSGDAWLSDLTEKLQTRRKSGQIYDATGKISDALLAELASEGYWGLFAPKAAGGSELTFQQLVRVMRTLALTQSTVAGLSSVHGCIGAVNALKTFGTEEQQQQLLPELVRGERLSAFALTEPAAGSDLAAIRTTFTRTDRGTIRVDGEKVFISNAAPGRVVHLVGKLDGKITSAICPLPEAETEQFAFHDYNLYPLKHLPNRGLIFSGWEFPEANLLQPPKGDGLAIAYHGLNYGRTSVCATATATLKTMLANLIPWIRARKTLGKSLAERQLVLRRIGRLGALIFGCEVLSDWAAGLLDAGYRGELECMTAKIFAAEAVREAAIDILMRTFGGRAFLEGQVFGDYLHDLLVPCIYEGESEVLRLAFFGSLLKPWLKSQQNLQQESGGGKWRRSLRFLTQKLSQKYLPGSPNLPTLPTNFERSAELALKTLSQTGVEMMSLAAKYRRGLEEQQGLMHDTSARAQSAVVLLVASLAGGGADASRVNAAAALCSSLQRELTGKRPTASDYKLLAATGEQMIDQPWPELELAQVAEMPLRYGE